jgi:magnesium transporter
VPASSRPGGAKRRPKRGRYQYANAIDTPSARSFGILRAVPEIHKTSTLRVVPGLAAAMPGPAELDALRALNGEYIRQHPEEVAQFLDGRLPAETASFLAQVPPQATAQLIERLNPRIGADVVMCLPPEICRAVLTAMNPARAAPVIVSMPPSEREPQLRRLEPRVASAIREVLSYPSDTAGALMDPRITSFSPDTTVDGALQKMRTFQEKELGAIYLMDVHGRFVGTVPLGELATAAPETKLGDLVRGAPVAVYVTASREEVVACLNEQRVATLPVVDADSRLVGVIRYRALVAAAEAEATMTLQTMVGVSKEERALSRISFAIHQRLPWLQVNLATAFLAAFVVGLFEDTIARYTALAVLLPVVAGQSGNSGLQALAVTMRGLALREVGLRHWPRLLAKEFGVGVLNGLAVAGTCMLGVMIWSGSLGLTVVIGCAMVFAMTIAGVAGASIPLILKALGFDPAQSSSIVLTTVTDVTGFLTFLGLATLFATVL